ncbi:hypothetical protein KR009_002802 [Drosophila setifemur]|nr:hypothetical protein KR009_002802 [Drosophila setifemur]
MAPKKPKKGPAPMKEEQDMGPQPPNVFLYIQLASITRLPPTINPLEIHISQGGGLIVKCSEHYNTDGIIYQHQFEKRPTFTLIFQQDNVDRINHAADNPLLVELYMRDSPRMPHIPREEGEDNEEREEGEEGEEELETPRVSFYNPTKESVLSEDIHTARVTAKLVLLCVGYLDVIKLFGHTRSMIREELFLYPMPDVPSELRTTVHTEWDLYTLLPIAKKLTFTNMAFVTLESIYCLKEEYQLDLETMRVQLSFRSRLPNEHNEYQYVPLCEFSNLEQMCIANQPTHHIFDSFRSAIEPWYVTGLKSTMEVELYRIFSEVHFAEGVSIDFTAIDQNFDEALVCNSFHRYILTQKMAEILSYAITCHQYLLVVEIFQMPNYTKPVKVFQGILDLSIMAYPNVQNMRFAVQLEYLGKLKPTPRRQTVESRRGVSSDQPTFAIIKLCLLAPVGEIYQELKIFRDSFIRQNRLLFCDQRLSPRLETPLADLQMDATARFDKFIRDSIAFIVEKRVNSIEDRKQHFCCAVQNLSNIMMKVVGSVYNTRCPTSTNAEFANLCALAYNDLERRAHGILEQMENEGFEHCTTGKEEERGRLIDYVDTIKLLHMVDDDRLADHLYGKAIIEYPSDERFNFYMLIADMERGLYKKAKSFFSVNHLPNKCEYYASWIKLYLNYVDTRDNPETAPDCTECLLRSLTLFAERNSHHQDAWILLYCYYKQFQYEPGCAYARWRFDEHHENQGDSSSTAPQSRWALSVTINPNFTSKRGFRFYEVFQIFVRLGLYEFGQVVFGAIEHLCGPADRYIIKTQLAILLNKLDDNFQLVSYEYKEGLEGEKAAAMHAQVNGNVEYHRGNLEEAALYYQVSLTLPELEQDERDCYVLGRLRLGYISYRMEDYFKCMDALNCEFSGRLLNMVADYMLGKAYYKIDDLEPSLQYFISCTKAESHVPNVWAFLALVNLRLNENHKAIECWKYAKIEPHVFIDDEMIFEELDAIDVDSVELFIDFPGDISHDLIDASESNSNI